MLEAEGHTVKVAADGKEGLQAFDAGWYHVVVTDRSMPNIGGDQLATLIKQRVADKPVVMLTGFGDMMDAADEKPRDVDILVSKPVSRAKMVQALSEATASCPEC
jgi:CheY-like chemotaxis protein